MRLFIMRQTMGQLLEIYQDTLAIYHDCPATCLPDKSDIKSLFLEAFVAAAQNDIERLAGIIETLRNKFLVESTPIEIQ